MKITALLTLVAVAAAAPSLNIETIHDGAAPILSSTNAEHIPNSYIIKFKKHVSENEVSSHQSWIQKMHTEAEQERMELRKRGLLDSFVDSFAGIKHTYKIGEGFMGYAGHFDESVIEKVRRHPDVCIRSASIASSLSFH
jgi:cerevisin